MSEADRLEKPITFTVRRKRCAGCGEQESRPWQFKAVLGGNPGVRCEGCAQVEVMKVTALRYMKAL